MSLRMLPWSRWSRWSRSCRATRPLDQSFLQRKLTTSSSPEAITTSSRHNHHLNSGWSYWNKVSSMFPACFQHVSSMEQRLKWRTAMIEERNEAHSRTQALSGLNQNTQPSFSLLSTWFIRARHRRLRVLRVFWVFWVSHPLKEFIGKLRLVEPHGAQTCTDVHGASESLESASSLISVHPNARKPGFTGAKCFTWDPLPEAVEWLVG